MNASILSIAMFMVLVVYLVLFWSWATYQAGRNLGEDLKTQKRWWWGFGIGITLWLGISGALAGTGVLRLFSAKPPPVAIFLVTLFIIAGWVALGPFGKRLIGGVGIAYLIGFQVFRLFIELIFHRLVIEGVMPVQMTYLGLNFDIVSGISAAFVAYLYAKGSMPRWGIWVWNIVCFGLLMTIITIAVLSIPLPIRMFMNEPANVFITYLPFIWLPGFLVLSALIGHLLIFRWLLSEAVEKQKHTAPKLASNLA